MRTFMSYFLMSCCFVSAGLAAETPTAPFQPLEYLIGHCWKGTLPNGKQTDEHCFSWIYDKKFVRDVHVVKGGGQPDHSGESIYRWNADSKTVEYLYIESDGGSSRGTVSSEGNALVFPPTSYVEDGKTLTYRSRWVHSTDDTYDVATEFQSKSDWVPGFSFHMEKVSKH